MKPTAHNQTSGIATIVDDFRRNVGCPLLAAWRQCHLRSANRRPAIERGRTRPRSAKLDDDLDRPLMAEAV